MKINSNFTEMITQQSIIQYSWQKEVKNFSNNYTKGSLFKRLKQSENKVPQFSLITMYYAFLTEFCYFLPLFSYVHTL